MEGTAIVEERMRFVLRLKDGESMASFCREFARYGISGHNHNLAGPGVPGITDVPYSLVDLIHGYPCIQAVSMLICEHREYGRAV